MSTKKDSITKVVNLEKAFNKTTIEEFYYKIIIIIIMI